jgi:phosphate transport system substrate-binding protein
VLVHRQQKDADTGRAVLRFFDWGYRNGGAAAKELGYIPVPASVVDLVEKTWEKDLKDAGGQKLWPASKK